ncbi:MAG: hypothetical protein CVT70_12750 [Alphaproteobacteria bacterium HGW-Alphaproteobacteria-1]|jgi:hypothetical protein|nr:MAG: hypothetical protein CVT70_12750 [Alphaproteobacteria bacterium HGW-Alphaproteobacteria-1]
MIVRASLAVLLLCLPAPIVAQEAEWLVMARRGWSYELRETMVGRDLSIPVRISGRALLRADICLLGEAPRPETRAILDAFTALLGHVHGRAPRLIEAGEAQDCLESAQVLLRLRSGSAPETGMSRDIAWMEARFALGLPPRHDWTAIAPAMAQTFFGRRGAVTHILVEQAAGAGDAADALYFRSILIEELFQAFTFGMDILHIDAETPYLSKLEERPLRMARPPRPGTPEYRRALLGTNPPALCPFDILMLHAVAETPVAETNGPDFLAFIAAEFADLHARAQATMQDARFAPLLDPACRPIGG